MPTKVFSEIQADPALLEEIQDRAKDGEIEFTGLGVEDATTSAWMPDLESNEAKLFIRAVENIFELPHRDK